MQNLFRIFFVLALLAVGSPSYAKAPKDELSASQKTRIRVIVAQCGTLVEQRMRSIEAEARRRHQVPAYLIREADGSERSVSRDEFAHNAVMDCTLMEMANDPLLAPALVGPPAGFTRM